MHIYNRTRSRKPENRLSTKSIERETNPPLVQRRRTPKNTRPHLIKSGQDTRPPLQYRREEPKPIIFPKPERETNADTGINEINTLGKIQKRRAPIRGLLTWIRGI